MLFLLDTNAFSDLMVDDPRVRSRMSALNPSDQLITCTIVMGRLRSVSCDFQWDGDEIILPRAQPRCP